MTPAAPMLIALVAAAVLLPLRIRQLAVNTDFTTGFFLQRDVGVYIFYGVAVVACLAVAVTAFLAGKLPGSTLAQVKNPVCGAASFLLAFGFGYEALQIFSDLREAAASVGLSIYNTSILNGSFREMLEMIFAAVCIPAFVVYGIACFAGKYDWMKFTAVLFLAAPLWGICRVLGYFTYTISYLVLAELFCEMYATIFLMLFLFCYARRITQTGAEGGTWTVLASGLLSALFCILSSVPRLFTTLLGKGTVEGFAVKPVFVVGAVFAIVCVITMVLRGAKEPDPAEVAAESDEDGDIPVQPFTVE